jgi:hypothetical protein
MNIMFGGIIVVVVEVGDHAVDSRKKFGIVLESDHSTVTLLFRRG